MSGFDIKERLAVVVGTTIGLGTSNFKNAQLGLNGDFAIGSSIIGGLNLGRQQKIYSENYKSFKFRGTPFQENFEKGKYMDWDACFFIGVQTEG